MSYNKEDLKKLGLRIAKNINHDLQRSKMNAYLKPYFTESAVQFIDNENFLGITLNSKALDLKDSLDEMEKVRFINNMKLLQETVEYYLKKEKISDTFELKSFSDSPLLMPFFDEFTERYKNFALSIKKEAIEPTYMQNMLDYKEKISDTFELKSFSDSPLLMPSFDEFTERYKNFDLSIKKEAIEPTYMQNMLDDKVKSMVPGFAVNSYEITPEDIAGATTKDLKDELTKDNESPKVLADPVKGKNTVPNSSRYSYLSIDVNGQSDL